jgi:hypothetical protein
MSDRKWYVQRAMSAGDDAREPVHSQRAEAARGPFDARMVAESPAEIDYKAEFYAAEHMPTRQLEKRCARAAAKAGKFLASARAILESELAYFLELRHRLSAQGRRGGIEGWQCWVEKHFTCDVRTVNRALSTILGPERERQKPKSRKGRKQVVEALIYATEPAIRLARKYPKDDDANEFLESLETEELSGLVPEPKPRPENPIDELRRRKRVKTEELYRMGVQLAHAVADGSSSVRSDTPEGKRILGLAKHMLEIEKKAEPPQDELPRSPGDNFSVLDDPRQFCHAVHCNPEEPMGKHRRTLCGLPLQGLTTHAAQRPEVGNGMVDCLKCLANWEKFGMDDVRKSVQAALEAAKNRAEKEKERRRTT